MATLEKFNTPKAKCLWACLQRPNISKTGEYKDAYQISLILDPKKPEHKELLIKVEGLHGESGGKAKRGESKHPIKIIRDKEGKKTGLYEVKFISYFVDSPIDTFDAKTNKILRENNFIANESLVKVNWSYGFYKQGGGGVSLYLNAVQVIDLIEWEGRNAEDYGIESEEGYEEFKAPEDLKDDFENQNKDQEKNLKVDENELPPGQKIDPDVGF